MSFGLSRRGWFRSAVVSVGSLGARTAFPVERFGRPLGVQLYTVRTLMPTDARRTIESIAAIGYREAELDRASLPRLAPILKDNNIKPVSCHFETPLITGNWAVWEKAWDASKAPHAPRTMTFADAIESAKKFGIEYMTMAYVRPDERGDLEFFRKLADKMNRAAAECQAAGMKFCYHNHAFEFKGAEGQRPIDIFIDRLDAKTVGLEMDVFWVSVAGGDPVELLKKLRGRVPLLHLKDKARGTPVLYSEQAMAHEGFKEAGNGVLDFPAILRAAETTGVRHYFVEQDYTPGDPVASLRRSYEYLRRLSL